MLIECSFQVGVSKSDGAILSDECSFDTDGTRTINGLDDPTETDHPESGTCDLVTVAVDVDACTISLWTNGKKVNTIDIKKGVQYHPMIRLWFWQKPFEIEVVSTPQDVIEKLFI